ncbi:hypothetical protein AC579_9022 [Pseudocercospora musae]|uniref:Arb2 domain-containing protein n=1 Tax=Pseudocercospora musae TaxID=113226 RepID=A0A139IT04_9PEZI|nr:hypothetical protein AC579_9022 [Pseudocercospora musae]
MSLLCWRCIAGCQQHTALLEGSGCRENPSGIEILKKTLVEHCGPKSQLTRAGIIFHIPWSVYNTLSLAKPQLSNTPADFAHQHFTCTARRQQHRVEKRRITRVLTRYRIQNGAADSVHACPMLSTSVVTCMWDVLRSLSPNFTTKYKILYLSHHLLSLSGIQVYSSAVAITMFNCKRPPPEPKYEADLEKLGFRLNEKYQFTDDGGVFDFYHTDNDQANELRKEAFHTAARVKIAEVLRERYGIQELYLTGSKYHYERPQEPHVSILCTKVSELKKKHDIVVVIGEASGDAGVWAWRVAGKEGGIELGSAIGVAARLQSFGQGMRDDDFEDEREEPEVRANQVGKDSEKDTTPGLIVLNPGQLLYSHEMNKNMTHASWLHRRRLHALCDPRAIDPVHNRVKSHQDPERHLHTCFEHVLQQIMPDGARLYCIMIGDGSTHGLHVLDQILMNKNPTEIRGGKLEAAALIEPQHDAGDVTDKPDSPLGLFCSHFKEFLAQQGRSWVTSDTVPKGEYVALPVDKKQQQEEEELAEQLAKATLGHDSAPEDSASDSDGGVPLPDSARSAWALPPTPTPVAPAADDNTEWLTEEQPGGHPAEKKPVSCPTVSVGSNATAALEVVFPAVQDEVLNFIFSQILRARARPRPRDSE